MSTSNGTPAVQTKDVWKIYPQEPNPVEAVRGVSLEIESGDFVAMAGPSGSGKTTVLNLLGGLTRPTEGSIEIGGLEITAMPDKALARLRLPGRITAAGVGRQGDRTSRRDAEREAKDQAARCAP